MINNNIARWLVGIFVVVSLIISFSTSYQLSNAFSEFSEGIDEITAPYKIYEEQEESIERLLTENHYEVLSIYIVNYSANAPFFEWYGLEDNTICETNETYCSSDKVDVSVEMKSLGSRNEQVWDVLNIMNSIYPNAFTYKIKIKSPTDTCNYVIFEEYGVRGWYETYDLKNYELVQYQINNSVSCS